MSIKIITAKAFSVALDVDEQGKILNAPKGFSQFINMPLSFLEGVLKKNKFQSLTIEDVNETV
jgi:hypothetical protein